MRKKAITWMAAGMLLVTSALPAAAFAHPAQGSATMAGNMPSHLAGMSLAHEKEKHGKNDKEYREKEKKYYQWIVSLDKADLKIDFGGKDKASSVTVPLDGLPTKGKRGSTITWTSNKPAVLSNDGKTLVRPSAGDVKVTLTAVIKYGDVTTKKAFELTVKQLSSQQTTDQARVAADKQALAIDFGGNDKAGSVTVPLDALPVKGANGSTITWTSSNPAILSNDGKVLVRPATAEMKVTLLALIQYGSASDVKTFELTVKPLQSDQARVASDKQALAIDFGGNDKASSVTVPLDVLPAKGANGSTITWTSSNPAVLSNDGKVLVRPASTDVKVTLLALIQYGSASDIRTFELTVKQQVSDQARVAADKAALAIDFGGNDNAGSVTVPVDALPVKGANGSIITWTSSYPSILSNDGKVLIRPIAADMKVTLLALIQYGSASDVKTFELTIKQQQSDQTRVAADKAALKIGFGGNDNAGSVTMPLDTLPAKGANGSTITWTSSNPAVLSNDGKVLVRPAAGSGDTQVALIAFIRYNNAVDQTTFILTVKQNLLTDAQKIAADTAALVIGYTGTDSAVWVTGALTLPVKGANGSTIYWLSSNASVISNNGKTVVRPKDGSGDAVITLTAVLVNGSASSTKSFQVVVKEW
ncbi:immunoglobulin-like domain-containing protein [Gorillibacterium massiliense]|uniref:immunoglobulin-like domain-containing protein n=1 Tax=Gorillibacterium massiliense TaxID=1280390 RepID=UPI0004BA3336|nr:immunoglobulin-like domain-containing protein [Gorillibacterium massiliense]